MYEKALKLQHESLVHHGHNGKPSPWLLALLAPFLLRLDSMHGNKTHELETITTE